MGEGNGQGRQQKRDGQSVTKRRRTAPSSPSPSPSPCHACAAIIHSLPSLHTQSTLSLPERRGESDPRGDVTERKKGACILSSSSPASRRRFIDAAVDENRFSFSPSDVFPLCLFLFLSVPSIQPTITGLPTLEDRPRLAKR